MCALAQSIAPSNVRVALEAGCVPASARFRRFFLTALRAAAFMASLGFSQAFAQTEETKEESPAALTLFAGQVFGGTFQTESGVDVRLEDDSSFGVIFDYDEGANTQWEFLYMEQRTAADTSDVSQSEPSIGTDIQYLQGGGTYIGSGGRARPYLAGTAGITRIDPVGANRHSDMFWSLSIGGGVQIRTSERLGFRLEARVFGTFINSNSTFYCGSDLSGGQCVFELQGDVLWQSQVSAGLTFRF